MNLYSDSVGAYVYLLLASKTSARRYILSSPAGKSIYIDYLEDVIRRQVGTAEDVERYEKVLNKKGSKADFGISEHSIYATPQIY